MRPPAAAACSLGVAMWGRDELDDLPLWRQQSKLFERKHGAKKPKREKEREGKEEVEEGENLCFTFWAC